MSFYLFVKSIHVLSAVISITGFFIRGIWLIRNNPLLTSRWAKKLPHYNDALLLISALIMVFLSGQYPIILDWLTVKVVALVIYILLGMVALRWGKTKSVRVAAWVLALLTFGFIVSVAYTRSPLGIFSSL